MRPILRTVFIVLILPLILTAGIVKADPPEDNNEWTGVERAIELAGDAEKLVLIDVYAAWCPYCQRMQSDVYPDQRIEELIDEYFIPVRINIESDSSVRYLGQEFTEREFAQALGYQNVPTTFFMNSSGEVVGQQPGYLPVDVFSTLLEYVGSGAFESVSFEEFEQR